MMKASNVSSRLIQTREGFPAQNLQFIVLRHEHMFTVLTRHNHPIKS